MNKRTILAIFKKEWKILFSSKKVWVPMVIVPFLLCVLMPLSAVFLGIQTQSFAKLDPDLVKMVKTFTEQLPDGKIKDEFSSLKNINLQLIYLYINYLMIPFFLMSAIINSMVISSNSFAGEKERKTLETLLFSPITIKELFVGKVFASFVPSVGFIFIAYILVSILINVIVYPHFHFISLFTPTWMIFMFWFVPILVIFNILLNIMISAKVKSFQEAQQFGGLLVLPVVGIIISQVTGLFFINPLLLGLIGFVLLLFNFILLKIVMKFNERNALFESQIH